ncbi:MAG TPA: type I methionyl aminopeptidase [Candidatus Eisenbacteria bacterium]|jgi:methionyl aminopeptidase|nr:type I methionyl aminopeptidase [Candidatus Eisenbacteria bacterium]
MAERIRINTPEEMEKIRESAQIVGRCLLLLGKEVRPGITTQELDRIAEEYIRSQGGEPAFKGYRGYPASICASINEEVVHGIPSGKRVVKEGDVVSLDIGVKKAGFYGDAARTFAVGAVSEAAQRLLEATERSLYEGIDQARPGGRVSDISSAIEREVKRSGYSVVRALVGHGVGRELHEEPQVPNYGRPGEGPRLRTGMVLAIEPMVNLGGADVVTLADQWTVVSADKSLSAHFEHTVAIGEEGPIILSKIEAD